jgi:uncharacterized membrane protein
MKEAKFRSFFIWMLSLLLALGIYACTRQSEYSPPSRAGSDFSIEISELKSGVPQFFTHHYNRKPISFFVVKTGDGVMSFLDACNTCYRYKKGYKYQDGLLICNYCKEKYRIEQIAVGTGNCHPIKLAGRFKDGKYLIAVSELERYSNRF